MLKDIPEDELIEDDEDDDPRAMWADIQSTILKNQRK